MKKYLVAILIASIILNGCVGDNTSTSQTSSSKPNNAKLKSIGSLLIKASEEHIEKPDEREDEERKEEYDKIKDKIVVDHDTDKPATRDQKETIHNLLEKLPAELTQTFNQQEGKIKLINSSDWINTLKSEGVQTNNTKIIDKSGREVNISDAIVYLDTNAAKPTIYVNSNIPYSANADLRRELNYGLIRGLIKSQKISFDKSFIDVLKSSNKVQGIEYYNYPKLEEISKLDDTNVSTEDNQDQITTLFASIMADSLEYGDDYNNDWPQMADYLKEFEKKFDNIDLNSDVACPRGGGCDDTGFGFKIAEKANKNLEFTNDEKEKIKKYIQDNYSIYDKQDDKQLDLIVELTTQKDEGGEHNNSAIIKECVLGALAYQQIVKDYEKDIKDQKINRADYAKLDFLVSFSLSAQSKNNLKDSFTQEFLNKTFQFGIDPFEPINSHKKNTYTKSDIKNFLETYKEHTLNEKGGSDKLQVIGVTYDNGDKFTTKENNETKETNYSELLEYLKGKITPEETQNLGYNLIKINNFDKTDRKIDFDSTSGNNNFIRTILSQRLKNDISENDISDNNLNNPCPRSGGCNTYLEKLDEANLPPAGNDITDRLQNIEKLGQTTIMDNDPDGFMISVPQRGIQVVYSSNDKTNAHYSMTFSETEWDIDMLKRGTATYNASVATRKMFLYSVNKLNQLNSANQDDLNEVDKHYKDKFQNTKITDMNQLKTITISSVVEPTTYEKLWELKNPKEIKNTFIKETPLGKYLSIVLKEFGLTLKSVTLEKNKKV